MAGYFHPTFLYELLWCLAAAAVVLWADRRFRLAHGRTLALTVAVYCAGRLWIEMLRDDTAEHFLGLRLNVFTAVVVGVGAVVFFVALRGRPREVIDRGPGTPDVLDGDAEREDAQVSAVPGDGAGAPAPHDGEPPERL